MYQTKIVLGDYFQEGHHISYSYIILTNKTKQELLEAYIKSCEKLKFSLDDDPEVNPKYRVCSEYNQSYLSNEVINILKENNFPKVEEYKNELYEEDFIELLMWTIQQSLPDLEWSYDNIPCFNKSFNLGYGLFRLWIKKNLKHKFLLSTEEPLFNLLSLYLNNYNFNNKEFENYFEIILLKELNKTLKNRFDEDYELQEEIYNLYNNEFDRIIDELIVYCTENNLIDKLLKKI